MTNNYRFGVKKLTIIENKIKATLVRRGTDDELNVVIDYEKDKALENAVDAFVGRVMVYAEDAFGG